METKISYNGKYIFVENARIIFRNFSGEERKFNPAGNRNFGLRLTPDLQMDYLVISRHLILSSLQ